MSQRVEPHGLDSDHGSSGRRAHWRRNPGPHRSARTAEVRSFSLTLVRCTAVLHVGAWPTSFDTCVAFASATGSDRPKMFNTPSKSRSPGHLLAAIRASDDSTRRRATSLSLVKQASVCCVERPATRSTTSLATRTAPAICDSSVQRVTGESRLRGCAPSTEPIQVRARASSKSWYGRQQMSPFGRATLPTGRPSGRRGFGNTGQRWLEAPIKHLTVVVL